MIELPREQIAEICARHHVQELAVFGSVARGDDGPESDVDLLVTFSSEIQVSLFSYSRLQFEFEDLFSRKVDVVPKEDLKPLIRRRVLREASVIYRAG
jgi:predicted nucleotidyltransferase